MAKTAQVPVPHGTTATLLSLAGGVDNAPGNTLALYNAGTVNIILGGEDVTSANGWRALVVGAIIIIDVTEDLYALSASGSTDGEVDTMRVK